MMARPLSAVARRLRRLWRREDGSATIEFCFCVPALLMLFMASMESGLYMIRSVMMERGLDLALRDYRLGRMKTMDHDQIRDRMCNYTIYVADCRNNLKVWIQSIDTKTWKLPGKIDPETGQPSAYCGDRNQPLLLPLPGSTDETASNDIVLIRICALEDPIFPSTNFALRLRKDSATGKYELASSTVVVTEPN